MISPLLLPSPGITKKRYPAQLFYMTSRVQTHTYIAGIISWALRNHFKENYLLLRVKFNSLF